MGTLYIVATPIGNLEDITIRAIRILLSTPVIAAEDTRHTGILINILEKKYGGITNYQLPISKPKKFISVRDWNEAGVVESVIGELQNNDVALVSDAGTPLISDPGYKLVKTAKDLGLTVVPIPGPSAVTAALSAAGLPTNRFVFWGFWNAKYQLLQGATNIIYENPARMPKTLETIKHKWPEAEIVVASEMTKIHEQIGIFNPQTNSKLKGETTILAWLPGRGKGDVGHQVSADHANGDRNLQNRQNSGGHIG